MPKPNLKAVPPAIEPDDDPGALREPVTQPDIEQMEAVVLEAAQQQAPVVSRLARHREHADLAIKGLEAEESELIARRDLIERQAQSVVNGLNMHIEDIRAAKALYLNGLSQSLAATQPQEG